MRVMSFDLSSVCIGVIAAEVDDNKRVIKIKSCPIMPPKFSPETLGYLKSKKKLPNHKGQLSLAYAKPGETVITKEEKTKRDRQVRAGKDIYVLTEIGKSLNSLISAIKPDLILVEKNAIFNGILTSILLAKVMGTLLGVAGSLGITVQEYSVDRVRKNYNVGQLVKDFTRGKSFEELCLIPDITKRALGDLMTKKYGIKFNVDDESDACVVLDYWLNL